MKLLLLSSFLALSAAAPNGSSLFARSEPAELKQSSEPIAGKYIVKFKQDTDASVLHNTLSILSLKALNVYEHAFKGFAAHLDDQTLNRLRNHSYVEYIEQDAVASAAVMSQRTLTTQTSSTWGLARISHRDAGVPGYIYDTSAGQGICAYVVDSGIETSHPDFEGRATFLASYNGPAVDNFGHGTHVAGTLGSRTYGVAKKVSLYAIKVLDSKGSGDYSVIISGVDRAVSDARSRGCRGAVINLSIGGPYSQAMNDAATRAANTQGVFVAVAAGNNYGADAGNYSPSSAANVCCIGASTRDDVRSNFSNVGSSVDVFAPGSEVLSTWPGGTTNYDQGTSMATPHIAGLAAYLWALEGSNGGYPLCQRIQQLATQNALDDVPYGTNNLVAFNGNSQ